jgi:hypothetical protein
MKLDFISACSLVYTSVYLLMAAWLYEFFKNRFEDEGPTND